LTLLSKTLLEIPLLLGEPIKLSKTSEVFGFLLSSAHHLQPWRHFERHLQGNELREFGRLRALMAPDQALIEELNQPIYMVNAHQCPKSANKHEVTPE